MAGKKYMQLVNGKKSLTKSKDLSTGAADAGEIVALNAEGKIDSTMLQDIDNTNVPASEDLSSGDYVNIFDDGGVVKARKADNSNNRPAHGYVKDNVVAPANVTVFFEGTNANLSALTEGSRQYLGTAGSAVETPLDPTNAADDGKIHQLLGVAISATEVNTDIQDCIIL
tara:strand:+ start:2716 stop:3225 length:510 start_codon:yes stop_codon:yes gene_type:complete